ncbi:MAG: hypothetical protein R2867_12360 [Caldilineaceae bacterium]
MSLITIRQTTDDLRAGPNAEVCFDGAAGVPVTISDPFTDAEEQRLAWYFEEWLRYPFTGGVKAAEAAASTRAYGEALFAQTLRATDAIYSRYRQAPALWRRPWVALPDRGVTRLSPAALGDALGSRAGPAVAARRHDDPQHHAARRRPDSGARVGDDQPALVTARPHGKRDVAYRTIQRPLIEMLHRSQLPVQVDIVRPGSCGVGRPFHLGPAAPRGWPLPDDPF